MPVPIRQIASDVLEHVEGAIYSAEAAERLPCAEKEQLAEVLGPRRAGGEIGGFMVGYGRIWWNNVEYTVYIYNTYIYIELYICVYIYATHTYFIHACMHTYIDTWIHGYMDTWVHRYIDR